MSSISSHHTGSSYFVDCLHVYLRSRPSGTRCIWYSAVLSLPQGQVHLQSISLSVSPKNRHLLSFASFQEREFQRIQKLNVNNHRRHIISSCRHPLTFSYSPSILITCQMLIWLTTLYIQPYCNLNQVIKRAVISLVHPVADHCDTLVREQTGTRSLLQKWHFMISTATLLLPFDRVIVLNNVIQQLFHLCKRSISL